MLSAKKGPVENTGGPHLLGLAQVDLLPPEVRDGRRLGARRRILTYCVLGVVIFTILAIGLFYMLKVSADNRYEDAQQRATELAAEKRKYAAVTGVIRSIQETRDVRDYIVTTEISWADYIDAIAAQLPEGVVIETFEVIQASPTQRAPIANDPTLFSGMGTIAFTAISPDLPSASDWADSLNLVPGLQDAAIQISSLSMSDTGSRDDNELSYEVTATVQVNELALAGRTFDDRDIDGADSDNKQADSGSDGGETDR